MTPAQAIAALDAALAVAGEDVTLQRLASGVTVANTASCRAMVRGYKPEELVGAIVQGDTQVILSPTDLTAGNWPANMIVNGDKVVIQGRRRNVEAAAPILMTGTLVRIELQVRG